MSLQLGGGVEGGNLGPLGRSLVGARLFAAGAKTAASGEAVFTALGLPEAAASPPGPGPALGELQGRRRREARRGQTLEHHQVRSLNCAA